MKFTTSFTSSSNQISEEDSSDFDYNSNSDLDTDSDLEDPATATAPTHGIIRPCYLNNGNRMCSTEFAMRQNHQSRLNFEHPHLNFNGMMWFRDDDVLINQSLRSILTVYQPLYDPRDFNDINLCFHMTDPFLLLLYHPNVPTYMHRDVENIHRQELENDPIYSFTSKKHQKAAIKVASSEEHKIQRTAFDLPFCVSSEQFSNIRNTRVVAEKQYRKIRVMVTDEIEDTCSYIFWKILIEEDSW